ncbi:hypothetical protein TNCV_4643631 [Trichonephila clavipes]|nr:hypothetical protein TNCV_4643631 [Trichonephila clavipes]
MWTVFVKSWISVLMSLKIRHTEGFMYVKESQWLSGSAGGFASDRPPDRNICSCISALKSRNLRLAQQALVLMGCCATEFSSVHVKSVKPKALTVMDIENWACQPVFCPCHLTWFRNDEVHCQ